MSRIIKNDKFHGIVTNIRFGALVDVVRAPEPAQIITVSDE